MPLYPPQAHDWQCLIRSATKAQEDRVFTSVKPEMDGFVAHQIASTRERVSSSMPNDQAESWIL